MKLGHRELTTFGKSFVDDGREAWNEGRKTPHTEKLELFTEMSIKKGRFTSVFRRRQAFVREDRAFVQAQ
jgi:hypothetical protein